MLGFARQVVNKERVDTVWPAVLPCRLQQLTNRPFLHSENMNTISQVSRPILSRFTAKAGRSALILQAGFAAVIILMGGMARADNLNFLANPKPGCLIATFDFDGKMDAPVKIHPKYAHISDGADSINGSKALVARADENDSMWSVCFEIEPGLMKPFHHYRISFDYKLLESVGEKTHPYFYTRPRNLDGRQTSPAIEGPVNVVRRKVYEVVPADNPNGSLAIGIRGRGAVAVDNIRIEELPRVDTTIKADSNPNASWKDFAGVCAHPTRLSFYKTDEEVVALMDRMQELGIGYIRTDFAWRTLFPESFRAPDRDAMRRAELVVNEANKRGLRIVAILNAPPKWASSRPDAPSTLQHPPKNIADYERYVRIMAEKFKGRIQVWEIGNEPNWYKFWLAPFSDYLIQLHTASRILRATDSKNYILSGGLAATGFVGMWGANVDALPQLLEPKNAAAYDALSIHAYPSHPDEWIYLVNQISALMREKGVEKRIWVTETGFTVANKATEKDQADAMEMLFRKLAAHPRVDRVFIYNARSKPPPENDFERGLGLLNLDMTPRSSYQRLQKVFHDPVPAKNPALAGGN